MPDYQIDLDKIKILNHLDRQEALRLKSLREREADRKAREQFNAKVIGNDADGLLYVAVAGGNPIKARSLSSGNIAVGSIVSLFVPKGESVGFVDTKPS